MEQLSPVTFSIDNPVFDSQAVDKETSVVIGDLTRQHLIASNALRTAYEEIDRLNAVVRDLTQALSVQPVEETDSTA